MRMCGENENDYNDARAEARVEEHMALCNQVRARTAAVSAQFGNALQRR